MSDEELIGDLRKLNIPPLREPRTPGYYSQMAKGMIEELERVKPGELKEFKREQPIKRVKAWKDDFPGESKVFLIGGMVGVGFMTIIGITLLTIL